jgi:glycosyltransferase involved in cell wall biosynthesis
MVEIKISVVVCTYNRSALLRETVVSLLEQDINKNSYEIIVVDNNSTDSTQLMVEEIAIGKPPKVRYLKEHRQGLSFARNKGAKEANGEIVAYIDDDATAQEEWLQGLLEIYDDFPDAGIVGGMIEPVWLKKKPAWLVQNLVRNFGVLNYGNEIKELSFPETPFGGNFSINRELFHELGGFCENLGRKGVSLLASEEVLLCRLVEKKQKKIYYTPKAIVYHKIFPERLNRRYLLKRAYAQGISNVIIERELKQDQNVSWRNDLHDLKEMIKGAIRRILSGQREILTEDLFTIVFILGKLRKRLI